MLQSIAVWSDDIIIKPLPVELYHYNLIGQFLTILLFQFLKYTFISLNVQVKMAENVKCQLLCQANKQSMSVKLTGEQAKTFIDKIKHDYYVHL